MDEDAWRRVIVATMAQCYPGRAFAQDQAEAKFRRAFESAGIRVVSPRGSFAEGVGAGRKLYLPDGHFTVDGHRLAGDLLAEALAKDW